MRIDRWESTLASYLAAPVEFIWGETDCALWSATWVELCTGLDFTSNWRGKYSTERGAAVRMKRLGFDSVADITDAYLEPRPLSLARRGDLVLDPNGSLGICNGLKSHFIARDGQVIRDTLTCVGAWEVS